jgi:hypothetical protein
MMLTCRAETKEDSPTNNQPNLTGVGALGSAKIAKPTH